MSDTPFGGKGLSSMSRRSARTKGTKSAQIIRLPHDDFSFEACDLKGKTLLEKYDENRLYVDIVNGLIKSGSSALKRKVDAVKSETGINVDDLISDIESVAEDFEALASIFRMAAARLTVVKAKLV